MRKKIFSISVVLLFSMFIGFSAAQESVGSEDLQFNWRYLVDGEISAISAGEKNGEMVVVLGVADNVYVLDNQGTLLEEYSLGSPGQVSALEIADFDGDGVDELLVGFGWMETTDVDITSAYDISEFIPVDKDFLYKILESRGALYSIDDGRARQWGEVREWVKAIDWVDVDGDKLYDTVVVAGGYTKEYYKRYTDLAIMREECELVWDIDKEGSYTEAQCNACPGCGEGFTMYWDDDEGACFSNESWKECEWVEETIKGWNLSEKDSGNGTIIFFDKEGKLLSKARLAGLGGNFMNAEIVDLYRDNDREIVLGSGNDAYVFDHLGALEASYPTKFDVKYVYSTDLTGNGNADFVFNYVNQTDGSYGIAAINRDGSLLWVYPINATFMGAFYLKGKEETGINEILFVSDGVLYALDSRGVLDWSQGFKYHGVLLKKTGKIMPLDLDADGSEDFLVASGPAAYAYEFTGGFIKRMSGDKYFELGEDAFVHERYSEAKAYLESARQLYLESGFLEGVSECDSMLSVANEKLVGNRKAEADSKYAKAVTYYSGRQYEAALEQISIARQIYLEIGDAAAVERCDGFAQSIKEILAGKETTTTTSTTTSITTSTQAAGPDVGAMVSDNIVVAGALLIVVLILFFVVFRRKKPRVKKPKKEFYGMSVEQPPEKPKKKKKKKKKGRKKEVEVKLGSVEQGNSESLKEDWQALEEHWQELDKV